MPKSIELADGRTVLGEELDFKTVKEEWNEYHLSDGTRVRTKAVATNIYRVVDERGEPQNTPDGDPWVVVTNIRHIVADRETSVEGTAGGNDSD